MAGRHEKAAKSRAKPVPVEDSIKRAKARRESVAKKRAKELKETPEAVNARAREVLRREAEKKRDKVRDDTLKRQRAEIEKRLDTETHSGRPIGPGPHPGETVLVDESHVLKVPAGSQADVRRGERSIGMSPALAAPYGRTAAQDAVQRFRDTYPGIAEFWQQTMVGAAFDTLLAVAERHQTISEAARIKQCVHILSKEIGDPEKRINGLIAANNDLLARERAMRNERDELMLACRILGRALIKKIGPLDESRAQGFLNVVRNDVLGRE